ncbi:DMT family transporter [Effusibacillus lacus]|uniref:Membrane protein n=1 Tax=Effusibacillus lacus TaxID=1348429 RepID=A0A292YQE8_9BACL|nr:DMT family transporter [Effusibacillus lacus]TCS75661.1 transporter family-2 protein [Effusibacillus lacus]GAX90983.1 membrane protein [Effusibacillus lacus]
MQNWLYIGLMVLAGVMIGFQSPINTALSKKVGIMESSFISFTVGVLTLAVVATIWGKGNIKEVIHVPWWQWLGGFLGAIYVTSIIVAVPQVGVTTVMVAALAGQLTIALLIDQFGWFGLAPRPIDWQRVLGVFLLFVATWLIYSKR